jgi:peptide/nickel transport system permease protein
MDASTTTPRIPAAPSLQVLRQRGVQAAAVILLVSTTCFAIVQSLPGDIAFRIAAGRYGYDQVTAASADTVRAELGLDRPAWQQLLDWLGDLVTLNLGTSLVTGTSVAGELGLYLSSSLQLAGAALALALAVGATAGALAATRPGGDLDRITMLWVSGARALPPFLLGLVLALFFSVHLGVLPAAGHGEAGNIVLPAAILAVGLSGLFARVTRDTVGQIRQAESSASPPPRFGRTSGVPSPRAQEYRRDPAFLCRGAAADPHRGRRRHRKPLCLARPRPRPRACDFLAGHPMIQATALALALLVVALNAVVDLGSLALDPRPRRRELVL